MNCSQYEPWIALYVEGDLSSSKTRDVESHLQACSACRKLLDELKESQTLLKALAEESLPANAFATVRERVLEQVSHRRSTHRPWWVFLPTPGHWRPVLAAGFALLVSVGLIWLQFSRQPTGSQRSVEPSLSATRPTQAKVSQPLPEPSPLGEQSKPRDAMPMQVASVRRLRHHGEQAPEELIFSSPAEPVASTEEAPEELQQGTLLEPESPPVADVPPEEPPPLVIKLITDDPNIVIVWLVDQKVDSK